VVETAKDNGHRLSAVPAPTKVAASAENIIVCDPSKTFQEIIGFGGALTESSAWVLAQLPQEQHEYKKVPALLISSLSSQHTLLVLSLPLPPQQYASFSPFQALQQASFQVVHSLLLYYSLQDQPYLPNDQYWQKVQTFLLSLAHFPVPFVAFQPAAVKTFPSPRLIYLLV
jgi:hypothetical protein